ncbi:MAG: ribonuclease Z [Candidatus Aenigmarchaeota archaeon]|nr:ribonuclease Z [Candidatus Aenigmarchaeota archaeon]
MTQIEVTFLGTTAGIPTKYRNHASIHLLYRSEQESQFLFDCGEGTQRQIFSVGLNFMRINEIFISHWHADHFAGLLGLMETMNLEKRQKALTIFGPEAERFVDALLNLGYASKNFSIIAKDVPFEGTEIATLFDNPEFSIVSVPAKHGIPAASYAFVEKDRIKIDKEKIKKLGLPPQGPIYRKIKEEGHVAFKGKTITLDDIAFAEKGKKVVYSGDTMVTKNMIKLAEHADLLIHDSTFFEEDVFDKEYKHTTFEDVLRIAEEAKVKQVILTHISRRYQNVEVMKDKIKDYPNAKIAKDFMKVVVD